MDDNGSFSARSWDYFPTTSRENLATNRENLALRLMSNVTRDQDKPSYFRNGGFFHRDTGIPDPPFPMEYHHHHHHHHHLDYSILHNRDTKIMPAYTSGFGGIPDSSGSQAFQMMQPLESPKEEIPMIDEESDHTDAPIRKRTQTRSVKSPRKKKPKKVNNSAGDDLDEGSISKGRAEKKSTDFVINGIGLELSEIPAPVCSCTGNPQQCYRWGAGGWQSACCTISISQYPLPMSSKRKGARIAGRKMSQGAFKKVLERVAGEGHNLSHPIDLKTFWAKHGTNKFVTIRG